MKAPETSSSLGKSNPPAKTVEARRRNDDLLLDQTVLLQTLIDRLPDRIYVKDVLGRKVLCNEADCKASGGRVISDVQGKTDFELYGHKLAEEYWADDKKVLIEGEEIVNREEPGLDAKGNPVWVLTTKVPLRDSLGRICGLIGIGREITELKLIEKEMGEQTERLQIAAEMARQVSSTLDLEQLLALVTELIMKRFGYYHIGIHLVDKANGLIALRSAGGHAAQDLMTARPALPINGQSLFALVVRSHQYYLVPDTRANLAFTPQPLLPEARSEVIFPLTIGRKLIGVLDIQSQRVNDFQPNTVTILGTLADQIAMAIQNAFLFDQSLQRTEQLQKLSRATANIMGKLGKLGLEEVLTLIAKYSTELLDAQACGISIVERQDYLTLVAGYGYQEGGFPKGLNLEITSGFGTGLTGHIAYKGKLFNDYGEKLNQHFAVRGTTRNLPGSVECHSLLAIPLYKGTGKHRKLIGLLRAENKRKAGQISQEAHFNEADEWILNVFANTVVMAIESAQQVDQIKRSRKVGQEIAKASTIGKLPMTLKSIVRGAQSALGCDIATLYTYDAQSQHFLQAIGVGCCLENMIPPVELNKTSTAWKIIHSEKPFYVSADVPNDPFFSGKFASLENIQSTLAVQLRYEGKPVGVLFINQREYHQFTKDEIELAQQFGHQAAIAIRNTQLFQETQRLFELLQAMNSTMTSSRPLEETLSLVVKQAVRMSGIAGQMADYGYISLVEGSRLQYRVAWPLKRSARLKQTIGDIDLKGESRIGITGRAVKKRKSVNVGNVKNDPDYICINENVQSELVVPIIYEGEVVGVINLEHHAQNAFDDYDVYILENLAAQVAMTIQNARHYEQIRHDASMREGLLKVGQAILITQEPGQLLKILVDKIKEALQADIVTLYTYDQANDRVSLLTNYSGRLLNKDSAADLLKVSEHSVVREILRIKKPVFANDTLHEIAMNTGDFARHEKIRSSAGIPLLIADEPVGVVFVNYRTPHQFSEKQREDMQLFATQAAQAIQNARRYEDLRQQKGLVGARTALAFMGMANSIWGHSIQGHVINIRNTVTLIRQDMEQGRLPAEGFAQLSKRIEVIETQANRALEKEMIPPLSEVNAQVILLNDLIRERVNQLKLVEPYKDVNFQLSFKEELRVRVSPVWLRRVLDIVIDNGIKAMKKVSRKRIRIRTSVANDQVEIVVSDSGKGIPPKIVKRILVERIYQENQKGIGLGLLMAQAILQTYKGDIRLLKTGPSGTTFLLVLPLVRAG